MALARYRYSLVAYGLLGALIVAEQARATAPEQPAALAAPSASMRQRLKRWARAIALNSSDKATPNCTQVGSGRMSTAHGT